MSVYLFYVSISLFYLYNYPLSLCPTVHCPSVPLSHCTSLPLLVVYTPQRKCARRLNEEEIIYDDESVSQILLNDPNSAFISNPVTGQRVMHHLILIV